MHLHTIQCCLHQYHEQTPNYIGRVISAHEKLKHEKTLYLVRLNNLLASIARERYRFAKFQIE